MPFKGPWGTFYHIPKCGGMSLRYFLKNHFRDPGVELDDKRQHGLPKPEHDLTNAWTVVRHPGEWLLSYYAYIESREWHWPERPPEVDDLFRFADGMFWPTWVKAVTNQVPGAVGRVYGLYCVPGVKVYQMEHIDDIFSEPVPVKNVTEIKPVMTLGHWRMICAAEHDTLERYGYDDKPTEVVRL